MYAPLDDPYPFSALLFDLDGVLIDTTALHYRVWDEFARSRGFVPTRDQLLATNGRRADETIRLWLGESLTDPQVAAITADRETYFNRLLAVEPVPGRPRRTQILVHSLRAANIPMAVATSAHPRKRKALPRPNRLGRILPRSHLRRRRIARKTPPRTLPENRRPTRVPRY